ncbi:MAG: glycosyltransferase [Hyphomonas sp.]
MIPIRSGLVARRLPSGMRVAGLGRSGVTTSCGHPSNSGAMPAVWDPQKARHRRENGMTLKTVSVLIPTYNRADWLIECLESIFAQTRRPDEIIVIDDGSTDDTLERLKAYGSEIRVLTQENSGKSAALNRALPVAKGELIWIVDSDDLVTPDGLEILLAALEADPEAGFAYGRHDRFETGPDGRKRWMPTGYWEVCEPEDFLFETLLDMFVHQPAMLVKRELYERAGAFDESFIRSQDYEMLLRLATLGRPAPARRIVFHQRQHEGPRGTAAHVIWYADRERCWQRFDKIIFERLYDTLPLSKYLPNDDRQTEPGAIRRAFIRRGVVMARKNLWTVAGADFEKAARMSDKPLSLEEAADLRRLFMRKYAADDIVLMPEVKKLLLSLKQISVAGASMSVVIGRALVWRVRKALQGGNILMTFRLASLVINLNIPSKRKLREVPSSFVRKVSR